METIKLLNLDPVSTPATAEELEYIGRYLGPQTHLDSRCLPEAPPAIESDGDEQLAAPHVVQACIRAQRDGFQGVFVNCFADPGVHAARKLVNIPVYGGFQPVMHLALGIAHRVSILTVLPSVLPAIRRNVEAACLDGRVASVLSVDIPVLQLGDHEKLVGKLLEQSRLAVRSHGAQALVLGCTAMVGVAESLHTALQKEGLEIPVLEAAQTSLATLELTVKMGLCHSALADPPKSGKGVE